VVHMSTGAWYDPEQPGVIGSLDKHGNPNLLTLDKGTSRLAQGPSPQTRRGREIRWPAATRQCFRSANCSGRIASVSMSSTSGRLRIFSSPDAPRHICYEISRSPCRAAHENTTFRLLHKRNSTMSPACLCARRYFAVTRRHGLSVGTLDGHP
jgi:hypothetical protein